MEVNLAYASKSRSGLKRTYLSVVSVGLKRERDRMFDGGVSRAKYGHRPGFSFVCFRPSFRYQSISSQTRLKAWKSSDVP